MTDTSSSPNQQSAPGVGVASLIERLETCTGPDRELDLLIHIVLNPDGDVARVTAANPRGLHSHDGLAWELGTNCVLYENWSNNQCWSNGGYSVPAVTSSIDAAMTLVPKNCIWTLEQDAAWVRWLGVDDVSEVQGGFAGRGGKCTALALCIAALKARTLSESSS